MYSGKNVYTTSEKIYIILNCVLDQHLPLDFISRYKKGKKYYLNILSINATYQMLV